MSPSGATTRIDARGYFVFRDVAPGQVEVGASRLGFVPGPVQQVPFRAVPARALVHLNWALLLGPTSVFGRVDNLLGRRYSGNVVANERFGRFYEPAPPGSVSLGLSVGVGERSPRAGP